jgi:tRNA A-37 threonylcarbamoyl transferase component Bud32
MECVHGKLLSEYLDNRIELGIRFMMQKIGELVETLAEIQRNWIMHRDLRPVNMTLRDDRTICVIDLGIALIGEKQEPAAENSEFNGRPSTYRFVSQCLTKDVHYSRGWKSNVSLSELT